MTPDEMTCCACGFAISGFGSQFFFDQIEDSTIEHINGFNAQNIKELCRAFVFSKRGSKSMLQVLQPRIQTILHTFTSRELCYMLHGYSHKQALPKQFAKLMEEEITKYLRDIENVSLEEL